METPNSKRQKHNKGQDMISNLPDFIIGHILSFLPTKDAVRTSVLSKSWTYRWTFITDLHFEDTGRYSNRIVRRNLFLSFVYRVLLYLNSSSIQSFSLTISEKYEPCHLDQWISVVVSRGVKKLCVNSENKLTLSSHSIMKYKSLEQLVLCVVGCEIKVPTTACLSSLTVLNLSGIEFFGGTSNNSGKLHLDFPVLRTYKTTDCTWSPRIKCVTLKAPLLEVVSIKDVRHRLPPSNESHTAMNFCASSLTKFTYKGCLSPDTIVFDLSAAHIASAYIDIEHYIYAVENLQEMNALCSKLLKQFQNAKCLKFQRSYHGKELVLPLAKDLLADLPTFEMLSHMELGKITGENLLALLLKTPYLKTLVIPFGSLEGYENQHQLGFAKFVMENAVALKRMSFIADPKLSETSLEEVKEKLYTFKKCCSCMILEFLNSS
ncbi:F-box/FBD/LRR-repeat protein At3g14710-like [Lotus japonicus]|uniref:F-box/FBD/LRR-repeat protein At3g14710-like n=1 Tax=Lotus japonicus TaxID=34305 RepID=UPI00259074B0|nr:F-box/FBD/LRR-repeat protein At3g14710-like [Lotus japonicus]